MTRQDVAQAVLGVVETLERSSNEADPSKAEAVLWLDGERFSEIEDFISDQYLPGSLGPSFREGSDKGG